jgi:hypothetical protein
MPTSHHARLDTAQGLIDTTTPSPYVVVVHRF